MATQLGALVSKTGLVRVLAPPVNSDQATIGRLITADVALQFRFGPINVRRARNNIRPQAFAACQADWADFCASPFFAT